MYGRVKNSGFTQTSRPFTENTCTDDLCCNPLEFSLPPPLLAYLKQLYLQICFLKNIRSMSSISGVSPKKLLRRDEGGRIKLDITSKVFLFVCFVCVLLLLLMLFLSQFTKLLWLFVCFVCVLLLLLMLFLSQFTKLLWLLVNILCKFLCKFVWFFLVHLG